MYYAIARFKAAFRWLFIVTLADYRAYSAASDIPGYAGSYTWRGHCVAFRRDDGRIQFEW